MSLRKVRGNFERLFDKSLTDLVRGIRNNRDNEAKYIAQCVEEIKEELRQENMSVKANAIAKLNYLQMLGYDISWAAFNVIEVMSSTKFTHKRIGYLCASQSFYENTEVIMLTTNMIRKDLSSQNMFDAGCAMSGMACFVTTDLSRDLANDIMSLLNANKPYIRKKAVLLMYKVFLKYPEALKPAFPRLKEKLEDPDPGVQSAAVNVICELARKNPRNYLALAPVFFKLMTNSTNNWMLIKIIKLFGSLTPLEPRLGKKLIEPLTNLIHSTSAMSLLYECINTVIAVLISISSGLPNHNASIQLCVQKLRILIEDSDQNLKYLGLLAMSKILKTHPKSVQAHKDLILSCLEDKDESIRLRALDLLYGMVSKKNLMEIVRKLLTNVAENLLGNKYRDELIAKIIDICSQSDYQLITNFEWYISVLVDLSRVQGGTEHGSLIAQQMLDVAIRVETIRPFAAQQMTVLIENCEIFTNNTSVCEVLFAAAWICGEFSQHVPDKRKLMLSLLPSARFPSHIEAAFVHNSAKLFVEVALENTNSDESVDYKDAIADKLSSYLLSEDLEVQERASNFLQLLHQMPLWHNSLFKSNPLNPVAAKAQKKVPLPPGLDLDTPFVVIQVEKVPVDDALGFADNSDQENGKRVKKTKKTKKSKKDKENTDADSKEKKKKKSGKKVRKGEKKSRESQVEVAEEAVVVPSAVKKPLAPVIPGLASSNNFIVPQEKKSNKHKKVNGNETTEGPEVDVQTHHLVTIKGLEMPDGAQDDEMNSDDDVSGSDPHKALSKVVLDHPVVPVVRTAATTPAASKSSSSKKDGSKTKEKKKSKKTNGIVVEEEAQVSGDQKARKTKSGKKGKKSKEVEAPQREDYEEAISGIDAGAPDSLTPSLSAVPNAPSPILLLQNDSVSVYIDVLRPETDQIVLTTISISNRGREELFDLKLTWNQLPDDVTVDQEKEAGTSIVPGDSESISLRINVPAPAEFRLEGRLMYRVLEDVDSLVPFELMIPLSRFLVPTEGSQKLSDMVDGLTAFSSLVLHFTAAFPDFLSKLTTAIPLTVADQIGEAATLYGSLIGGSQRFCFLVKRLNEKEISVEAKGTTQQTLDLLLDQVKQLFVASS